MSETETKKPTHGFVAKRTQVHEPQTREWYNIEHWPDGSCTTVGYPTLECASEAFAKFVKDGKRASHIVRVVTTTHTKTTRITPIPEAPDA